MHIPNRKDTSSNLRRDAVCERSQESNVLTFCFAFFYYEASISKCIILEGYCLKILKTCALKMSQKLRHDLCMNSSDPETWKWRTKKLRCNGKEPKLK